MYKNYIKRVTDVIMSAVGLVVISPVLLVIAVLIKLDSPGPVLFKQKRVGMGKRYFNILKFRTMRSDTPKNVPTHMLKEPRLYITKTGAFLRKYSLDELIQIVNILKGDMSFIGPRPALWNQYDLIEERDKYGANDIRPGLTGLAQINGRDELSIEDKAELDGEYVKRISFLEDMRIFFSTFRGVVRHEGVAEGCCEYNSEFDDAQLCTDKKGESSR